MEAQLPCKQRVIGSSPISSPTRKSEYARHRKSGELKVMIEKQTALFLVIMPYQLWAIGSME